MSATWRKTNIAVLGCEILSAMTALNNEILCFCNPPQQQLHTDGPSTDREAGTKTEMMRRSIRNQRWLHLLHTDYQHPHSTSKVRTYLQSEAILAGPLTSKDCLRVLTFKVEFKTGFRLKVKQGRG